MVQARATARAEQLLKAWGRSKALEVAERNIAEAKRSGSPEQKAFSDAVRDEIRRLASAAAPAR